MRCCSRWPMLVFCWSPVMEETTEMAGVRVPSPISMQVAPSTRISSSLCRARLRCMARLTCMAAACVEPNVWYSGSVSRIRRQYARCTEGCEVQAQICAMHHMWDPIAAGL